MLSGAAASISCSGLCDGSVNTNTAGGTPPYSYTWSNGATTQNLAGLCPSNYSVTVTDYNYCIKTMTWNVGNSSTPCPCPGLPSIVYDGQTYSTVQLGQQCWLGQNLNAGIKLTGNNAQTNNGIIEKHCYNDIDANCSVYGGLYEWNESMNYATASNTNPSGRQGICPLGWHLPSDTEWCQLETYLEPSILCGNIGWFGSLVGGMLKESGTSHWVAPNSGASNITGFTALPAGISSVGGGFGSLQQSAFFWSSSEYSQWDAWYRSLDYAKTMINRDNFDSKSYRFSVRCVKN
jgi:uncharacterized protein (TIGR02145 family)